VKPVNNAAYQVSGDFDGQWRDVVGEFGDKPLQNSREVVVLSLANQRQQI